MMDLMLIPDVDADYTSIHSDKLKQKERPQEFEDNLFVSILLSTIFETTYIM